MEAKGSSLVESGEYQPPTDLLSDDLPNPNSLDAAGPKAANASPIQPRSHLSGILLHPPPPEDEEDEFGGKDVFDDTETIGYYDEAVGEPRRNGDPFHDDDQHPPHGGDDYGDDKGGKAYFGDGVYRDDQNASPSGYHGDGIYHDEPNHSGYYGGTVYADDPESEYYAHSDEDGVYRDNPQPHSGGSQMVLYDGSFEPPSDEYGYVGREEVPLAHEDDMYQNPGSKLRGLRPIRRRRRRGRQGDPETESRRRRRCNTRAIAWCCSIFCCILFLVLLILLLLAAKLRWFDTNDNTPTPEEEVNDDFEPYTPFEGITTTPFDEYEKDDCYWEDNLWPHVINQCQCKDKVVKVANDTMELYWKVREEINDEIYQGRYDEDQFSCAPSNVALIWLSSGDMRDGGDLYQRYILAMTYLTLNGTMWDQDNLWLSEDNECLWFGDQCNYNYRVNSIAIDMNNVHGSLPTEISKMEGLKSISITRNHLTGTIPPEIFNLPGLESLILYANQLRGSIPADVERATNLHTLKLENNLFFGRLVTQIGSLSELEEFTIGFNEFWRTVPTEIEKLTNMKILDLQDNRFSGTLHTEFALMTDLEKFLLSNNLMTGTIPTELAALTKLEEFRLATTGLGGSFPTQLGSLTSLYRLDLGFNNFKGTLITEFGQMTRLSMLSINNNDFTGQIPTEFGNLVNMTRLLMNDCLLTGDLPSELGRMTMLQQFMLDKNSLTGTAPQQVCSLRQKYLDVFVADCPKSGDGFVCPSGCCSFCRQTDTHSRSNVTFNPSLPSAGGIDVKPDDETSQSTNHTQTPGSVGKNATDTSNAASPDTDGGAAVTDDKGYADDNSY
jgi:Leucine-rich repeat (LRR) protein